MAFPAAFLDELIARSPIEDVVGQYVTLQRRGSNLFGLCPFHSEKTPSFSVSPEKGIYYCFGCHKGGGPVNFIMEIESLDYPDAVRFLAKRAGLEVPEDEGYRSNYRRQERLWTLCRDAGRFFHEQLSEPNAGEVRAYIQKRGLSPAIITRFGLGFAPNEWSALMDAMMQKGYSKQELLDAGLVSVSQKGSVYDKFRNRLMFPIIDIRGNVIAFGGRVMDDSTPKYLNSPETIIFNKRKNLFALNVAKKSKQGRIILTEGYMDAITLHQYGFDCAVASLGTALTEEHANILAKYTKQVILTYDGDEPGQNATRRAIPMLEKTGLEVRVLRMQGAKDPDEFLHKFGADRFSLLLDGAENQAEYGLESLRRKYDLSQDEQRVAFLKEAAGFIASLPNAVQREIYGARAAEAAGVSAEAVKLETDKAYRRRAAMERKKQENIDLAPARQLQPKVRGIRYDNVRSAMAEEGLLRLLLREPALIPEAKVLPEQFSSELLGRAYRAVCERYSEGGTVSAAVLEGQFSPEEMTHLTGVLAKEDTLVSDNALRDYLFVIREEYERTHHPDKDPNALLALKEQRKQKMGYGG
jgi:DNA primase